MDILFYCGIAAYTAVGLFFVSYIHYVNTIKAEAKLHLIGQLALAIAWPVYVIIAFGKAAADKIETEDEDD